MVRIKPFRAVRPPREHAAEVASRPYDVLNSAEAKSEATERSLLHIIKPEIDFEPIADEHSQQVYDRAVDNFRRWRSEGWLQQDPEEYYYIYAQTMEGRTQYGLAMCCHFEDYLSGAIKKHELTRPDKEEDRMIHVRNQQANIEPVFFAYPDNAEIDAIVAGVVSSSAPEYDFTAADGFGHRLWVIRDRKTNDRITEISRASPRSTSPTDTIVPPPPPASVPSARPRIPAIAVRRSIVISWPSPSPPDSSASSTTTASSRI